MGKKVSVGDKIKQDEIKRLTLRQRELIKIKAVREYEENRKELEELQNTKPPAPTRMPQGGKSGYSRPID